MLSKGGVGYPTTMNFQQENNELIKAFLNDTFFKEWRNPGRNPNFRGLELQINAICNLDCKYCYYKNYGHELYPHNISNPETILKNLEITLNWLYENKFRPEFEIFTGELFVQKVGRHALNMIYDFYKDKDDNVKPPAIVIPTNYTFITDEELTNYAELMIEKFDKINIPFILSASFDGKLIEKDNRPYKKFINHPELDPRDDNYYDKVFEFNKKYGFGFHPMIYSNKIELWKDNFLWFQEMFEKHDIPWNNIYLLEVRNAEWNTDQIIEFGKFIEFLIEYSFDKVGKDKFKFFEFLFKYRGFNILSSAITTIGRGIGCSLQSLLYLRLGDMAIVPCHRTMYPGFEYARFKIENDKIVDIEAVNPELMISTIGFDAATQPYCEKCTIRELCSHGCLGAQLEVTGDMFTPIPTTCMMEHYKYYSMFKKYKELGILEDIFNFMSLEKRNEVIKLMELFEEGDLNE